MRGTAAITSLLTPVVVAQNNERNFNFGTAMLAL